MYKQLLLFLFILLLISCNKNRTSTLIETTIDFSKVDSPPVFKQCKNLINKEKEQCFKETIKNTFTKELSKILVKENNLRNNKVTIKLTFNKTGKILIERINFSSIFAEESLEFEKAIKKAVKKLEVTHPAIKQGIPVTTVYVLPIQIHLNE